MKIKNKLNNASSKAWMLTFADLLSLMLTFFVLSYSMSVVVPQQWVAIKDSLSQRFSPIIKDDVTDLIEDFNIEKKESKNVTNLDYLSELLRFRISQVKELSGIQVINLSDSVVIRLPEDSLFTPNSADVTQKADRIIYALAELLNNFSNQLDVLGHTDTNPVSKKYRSNWELSLLRSMKYAELLKKYGYQNDINILGVADADFNELGEKTSLNQKLNIARRVDIIIKDYKIINDGI